MHLTGPTRGACHTTARCPIDRRSGGRVEASEEVAHLEILLATCIAKESGQKSTWIAAAAILTSSFAVAISVLAFVGGDGSLVGWLILAMAAAAGTWVVLGVDSGRTLAREHGLTSKAVAERLAAVRSRAPSDGRPSPTADDVVEPPVGFRRIVLAALMFALQYLRLRRRHSACWRRRRR